MTRRVMTHPPLKRHPVLAPLSREHFNGLVQVRRLRQAADGDSNQRKVALAGFLANWSAEMAHHFDDEERLLGPFLTPADDRRLRDEHAALRARASEGCDQHGADPGPDWLRDLADRLERHIRWEERELYERVQHTAPPEALEALRPAAEQIENRRPGAARRGRRAGGAETRP